MKVLLCGLGSIGRRQARLLEERAGIELYALRSGHPGGPEAERPAGITHIDSLSALDPDVVFITNPTHLHADTALACLERGTRRLFIEKPIDCDPARVQRLAAAAREREAAIHVGYCLRFHPVVRVLRDAMEGRSPYHLRLVATSWLPNWRPGVDYRETYSADASRGGGVLLDLSHEIDLAEHLTGERVEEIVGRVRRSGRLEVRAEDEADLVLRLSAGTLANVHLSFSSRHTERTVSVDHSGGRVVADLVSGVVAAPGEVGAHERSLSTDRDDMYRAQLDYFFAAPPEDLRREFERCTALTLKLLRFREGATA